jgi:hypothetical protein
MKSYKTTSAGILMIAGAVLSLVFANGPINQEDIKMALAGILGGIGLIFAKDFDKTGTH